MLTTELLIPFPVWSHGVPSGDPVTTTKYEVTDPDVRLMLQVREGHAAAFEQLVERYQARLVGILEHLVPGAGQAEDLAQEVFMRVYRARESYQPTARFSTWLFTIANNVANNAIRKLVRRKEIHLQATPSGTALARPLDNMAKAASGLMPARQLARSEVAEIVKLAIQSLGERQRTALLLSKYEHMSYEEIGQTMELSSQAVKSLLSRARANLRDILQPYMQLGTRPGDVTPPANDTQAPAGPPGVTRTGSPGQDAR